MPDFKEKTRDGLFEESTKMWNISCGTLDCTCRSDTSEVIVVEVKPVQYWKCHQCGSYEY